MIASTISSTPSERSTPISRRRSRGEVVSEPVLEAWRQAATTRASIKP